MTNSNLVVHCKRRLYDIYIGRPSKWGNPFVIGKDGTREEVLLKYRKYLISNANLISCLPELKGKVLGCWCSPKPCHGDILVKLANLEEKFVTIKKGRIRVGNQSLRPRCPNCETAVATTWKLCKGCSATINWTE